MSFTLSSLKTALQDYTDNSESNFVTHLPDFIKAAEEKILKSIDLEFFRKNVSSTLTSSDKFLSTPTDYLASFSLQITTSGSETFLKQKDVNFLQEIYSTSSSTGVPRYYAVFDINNFILAPTPNSNYTIELHYFYRPTSLTAGADSGTTWLSTNAPFALLYGSLIEAYTFMKGEADILQLYNGRFGEAMQRLKSYAEGTENTDAYREGLVRVPKS